MKCTKMFAMLLALAMVMTMGSFALAEETETIKIGMIGPLTGGAASYGIAVKQGAELAVEEINALGGMQIELYCEDDEADGEKGLNAYNTLLDKGVQMFDGCVTSGSCATVAATAYEDRVFMLTPSASSLSVVNDNDNVFQVCFTDPAMGAAVAQYIVDNQLATSVAVIYNNADDYSTGTYQAFKAKADELGLTIAGDPSTFNNDTTDFSVQVAAAKASGADLVFMPIYYTPASMILQAANAIDWHPTFFGTDGLDGILSMEGFDKSLAEGMMLLTPFSATSTEEKTAAFVANYEAKYGETPIQFAADSYDAIYVLYEAAQTAGITSDMTAEECCDKLIETIQTMTVEGITGTMTWSATGEVTKDPKAVVIKDGVYVDM